MKTAIQCTAENGEKGSFGFIGEYPNNYKRVSPVFNDLVKFFDWRKKNPLGTEINN